MIDYTVFKLSSDADHNDVEKAYVALRRKYRSDMLCEGEKGAEAARAYERLEAEYKKFLDEGIVYIPSYAQVKEYVNFTEIEELIKCGKVVEAQERLDKVVDRAAEWHFVQALVYYKKSWFLECKKQLELALKLDPNNKKYKDNYLSLLAYAEIMQQKAVAREQEQQSAAAKSNDCCAANSGSCTAPCIADCCFKDDKDN